MVYYNAYLPGKAEMMEILSHAVWLMPLSMILYLLSTADKLLFANAISLSTLFSGVSPLGQLNLLYFALLLVLFQMHLFPGTVVPFHHRISCMHLLSKFISFCQIDFSDWHSMSILPSLMLTILINYMFLLC